MPRKRREPTVSVDTVEPEVTADETAEETEPKVDYTQYPRHLRAEYKRRDKAAFSLRRLEKRLERAKATLAAAETLIAEKAEPLREQVIRSNVLIASATETETRVQAELAKYHASLNEEAAVAETEVAPTPEFSESE